MAEAKKGDATKIACCGLYCGACGKCGPTGSCATNEAASRWCGIRTCNKQHGFKTCAECPVYPDPKACATFHTFIGRCFGYFYGSDRPACITRIRAIGPQAYADEMATAGTPAIKKTSWNPLDW